MQNTKKNGMNLGQPSFLLLAKSRQDIVYDLMEAGGINSGHPR
jgi:hypothetical protein